MIVREARDEMSIQRRRREAGEASLTMGWHLRKGEDGEGIGHADE